MVIAKSVDNFENSSLSSRDAFPGHIEGCGVAKIRRLSRILRYTSAPALRLHPDRVEGMLLPGTLQ